MLLIIALILAILIILLGAYVTYRIAFHAPKHITDEEVLQHLPSTPVYQRFQKELRASVESMLVRSFEPVTITTFDGKKLYARYYHTANHAPVHIIFHGYKGNAVLDCSGGTAYALNLGHNALVVDQRSHGKSEGNAITFGVKERKDCLCWIHYVLDRFGFDTKIILSGLSMGAATVLMALDQELPENVVGVIADCPYSSPSAIIKKVCRVEMHLPSGLMYPLVKLGARLFAGFDLEESSAIDAVRNTKLPILLIHGETDTFVPCDMSREIQKANPSVVSLLTIPNAEHALSFIVGPKQYEEAVTAFVKEVSAS